TPAPPGGAVRVTLNEMSSGYGRQALQFVQCENHGTVHHAVNQDTMLLGVDVRRYVTVRIVVMERGWSDVPDHILKRSQCPKERTAEFPVWVMVEGADAADAS